MNNFESLVETQWLKNNLKNKIIIDGSWYLPAQERNPYQEYCSTHITGALFFDIDKISNLNSPLPHMLPSENFFSQKISEMGINNNDHIIIYDGIGLQSAARVWWTFKVFGHEKVSILNGGLPKWIEEDLPTSQTIETFNRSKYNATYNANYVRTLEQIKNNIDKQSEELVDARSYNRFKAIEKEPRANLKSGHIPNSLNLPYLDLLSPEKNTLKNKNEIKKLFLKSGINLDKPIITTCGSGITASILAFALHLLGKEDFSVYDGSWTEWGAKKDFPIEI
ncbi:3-mercaptopyruvate sulfurtransferase [Alphaproteobacteria bacterium]|nr:3-mercaptopyruvate sulfurtransferase [Alphaproteobacteria bacterium]